MNRALLAVILLLVLAAAGYGAQRLALLSWNAVVEYRSPLAKPLPFASGGSALAERIVLVVVDGLRLDASRTMTVLNDLRARGSDFVAWTGEPSLSFPGWTAIASGASQEVSGVTTNWFEGPVPIDHLFASAKRAGLRTAVAGSTGWDELFAGRFDDQVLIPDPKEYTRVEELYKTSADVAAGARQILRGDARFVLIHFPSVDLAGHGFGATSPEYAESVSRVDAHLAELLREMDLTITTVIVTSDHGHIDTGGHGGWEPVVKQVPLVLAGRGIRPGIQGPEVHQLDIAPTVAALLGIGIPAHSQGRPLVEALDGDLSGVREQWVRQQQAFYQAYADFLGSASLQRVFASQGTAAVSAMPDRVKVLASDVAREMTRARQQRLAAERMRRLPIAVGLAVLPALYLIFSSRRRSIWVALLGTAAFFAIDYALFRARGYTFSLSVFNTESNILAFFNQRLMDAAIAIAAGAVVVGLSAVRRSPGDAALLAIDTGFAVAYAIVLQVLYFYWLWDVRFPWYLPDLRLGFKYYLDLLKLVPVGFLAAGYMLLALLARGVGRLIFKAL